MSEDLISFLVFFGTAVTISIIILITLGIVKIKNNILEKRYREHQEEGKDDPFLIRLHELSSTLRQLRHEFYELSDKYDQTIKELRDKVLYLENDELQTLRDTARNCESRKAELSMQIKALEKEYDELVNNNREKYEYYIG